MSLKSRVDGLRRKAAEFFYPRTAYTGSLLVPTPLPAVGYDAGQGQGLLSSVVMPVIQWIMRSFPEAPLVVREQTDDSYEIVPQHPLVNLVNRPNAFYPGTLLWMVTLIDWTWFGESYWRILRQRGGLPGELWWLPPWTVDPRWPSDGSAFLTHYDYRPEIGTTIRLELEDVLHFRHGLDPWNPRHGLPPLRAAVREIWSDAEASNWVSALLRNMAIPGLILSPKAEGTSVLTDEEVDRIKAYVRGRFTGEQRGEPMIFGEPTQVERLSWSPNEMDLTVVRNIAEERVTAALGIPAAVVGFGTGLDTTKVGATMIEFVKLAWNNGLVPLQRLLAAELQRVLLPAFEQDTERYRVGWDYDEVQALQEDQNRLADRYIGLVNGGILKVSEAREALGYESTPEDEIYLRSSAQQPVDPDDQMPPEPEPIIPLPTATPGMADDPWNGGPPATDRRGQAARNGTQRRALRASAVLKQGTFEEFVTAQIGRHATRMDAPPLALKRLAAKLMREEKRYQRVFQRMLLDVLQRYGDQAALAAREIFPQKQASFDDMVRTSVITERLPQITVRAELAAVYAAIAEQLTDVITKVYQEAMGLELTSDVRLTTIVQQAAVERVRLLDLEQEARTTVLKVLETASAEGWSEDRIIDAIRDQVPAGRWTSSQMRAEIIARTEGRVSMNMASSLFAQQSGVGKVLILDALLGPTDALCTLVNGWVVTPAEAQALAQAEHPQGTRMVVALAPAAVPSIGASLGATSSEIMA